MKKNLVQVAIAFSFLSATLSTAHAANVNSEISGGSASVSAWIYSGLISIYANGSQDDFNHIIDVPAYGEAFNKKIVAKNPSSSLTCEDLGSEVKCSISLSAYSEKVASGPGAIFESLARAKQLDSSINVIVKTGEVKRKAPATSQDSATDVQEISLVADDGIDSIRCIKTLTKDVWKSQPEQAITHRTYVCKVYSK